MRKSVVRMLAVCLLAMMLLGSMVPACAASKKPKLSIEGETLYVGRGETVITATDMPKGAKFNSISSSDTEVLTVGKHDGYDGFGGLWMKPLKAGESRVTVKYSYGGKNLKLTRDFTVKKYPKAFAWIRIDGKKINLKKNKFQISVESYKRKKARVTFKLNKNWKVKACGGTGFSSSLIEAIAWSPKKVIDLSRYDAQINLYIDLVNKRTGDHFLYLIYLSR